MIIRLDQPTECAILCKLIQQIISRHERETGFPAEALSINVVSIIEQNVEQKCLTDET